MFRETPQLIEVAVFRTGIGTLFSTWAGKDLDNGELAQTAIMLDEEGDKENHFPTTSASELHIERQRLLKGRPLWMRIANLTEYFYRTLFAY